MWNVDIIELLFVALEHWKHRAGVRNKRPVEEIPLRSRRSCEIKQSRDVVCNVGALSFQ